MASRADHSRTAHGPAAAAQGGATYRVFVILFLLAGTQPYSLLFGPILIGPYRVVLAIIILPLVVQWLAGRFGGRILPDYLVMLHILWMAPSLAVNGQADRILEYVGAEFIDGFGAYLLGRAAIRNREDFYFFAKAFLALLLFLFPFAILESTQGRMIIQDLFRGLPNIRMFNPITLTYPERMGMMRAQTSINHPILYGVFCSIGFSFAMLGLKYAGNGTGLVSRMVWAMGSAGGTVFSFSAGALVNLAVQGVLMSWQKIMGAMMSHWKLFASLFAASYIFLQFYAERPPLLVMARLVAFNPSTTFNRYLIWQYGTDEVMRNPVFGKALFSDWIRAPWMSLSTDNHWLLLAMRWGFPGIILILVAYFYIIRKLSQVELRDRDPATASIRDAFVFTFIGLFLSLGTVVAAHITQSLIFFVLGAAVWIFNEYQPAGTGAVQPAHGPARPPRVFQRGTPTLTRQGTQDAPAPPPEPTRYTRFPDGRKPARREPDR